MIKIESHIVPGVQGKGKEFTFIIKQAFDVPKCDKAIFDCIVNADVEIELNFPIRNPLVGFYQLNLEGMDIHVKSFTLSNSASTIDLALNADSTFTVSVGNYYVQDGQGYNIRQKIWAEVDEITTYPLLSNMKGSFTNRYTGSDGSVKEVKITGSAIGTISDFYFLANITEVDDNDFLKEKLWFSDFETDNNIPIPATLDVGTVSGFMEGANLKVNFATELVE